MFREAKSMAASQGKSIRQFFTEAISEKLLLLNRRRTQRPWMKHFGALKEYTNELKDIDVIVEEEFETINLADWE